jgi:hypothetical protein
MMRNVEPELLDSLPANDPAAQHSRRDLARINVLMRQAHLMAAMLRPLPQPDRIVDMGSGDGRFLLSLAQRLDWAGTDALAADRQDIISRRMKYQLEQAGWTVRTAQGDIFEILESLPPSPSLAREPATGDPPSSANARGGNGPANGPIVITANLFLHHFQDEDLRRLLALAASRCSAFVACEPRRSKFALLAARLTVLIAANHVTRHDAAASVRAGFSGNELTALWPREGWTVSEGPRFPFSHCFSAVRNAF